MEELSACIEIPLFKAELGEGASQSENAALSGIVCLENKYSGTSESWKEQQPMREFKIPT